MATTSGTAKTADAAGRTATRLLAALPDEARAAATAPFEPGRLRDWHYVPRERPGLPVGRMDGTAEGLLWELLATVLSPAGRRRAADILVLEGILGEITDRRALRDPGNYALLVMGDPSGGAPWTFRFEGHHLSVTVTVAPGAGVAATPTFFGANPARVPQGHDHAGFRPLAEEEDMAFSLVNALEGEVRATALIADRSLGDIVAGPGREEMVRRHEGVPLAAMGEGEATRARDIAARFAACLEEPLAREALERLREDGSLHFAWAGSLARGAPHYFRIHGARTLLEYDNTQDGANHVHTVFIDPVDLFGADLLARHHATGHHR